MTALPRQIAFAHCPVCDPTRGFEGCKCGAPVTGQAHQEHVVEVTEAAVRERVAADIEASKAQIDKGGSGYDERHQSAVSHGLFVAARIARGEVTP